MNTTEQAQGAGWARASIISAFAAVGISACCILPMVFLVLGLGGAWLAIFAKFAAIAYYVAGASALLLAASWVVAIRRHSPRRTRVILSVGSVLSALAWVLVLYEGPINDYLMMNYM